MEESSKGKAASAEAQRVQTLASYRREENILSQEATEVSAQVRQLEAQLRSGLRTPRGGSEGAWGKAWRRAGAGVAGVGWRGAARRNAQHAAHLGTEPLPGARSELHRRALKAKQSELDEKRTQLQQRQRMMLDSMGSKHVSRPLSRAGSRARAAGALATL
jgi:hypothetical protein